MSPVLVLGIHIVLIYSVFVWERPFYLSDVVIQLLTSLLINRCTDRPDHTEEEVQLNHTFKVFLVIWVDLNRQEVEHIYIIDLTQKKIKLSFKDHNPL